MLPTHEIGAIPVNSAALHLEDSQCQIVRESIVGTPLQDLSEARRIEDAFALQGARELSPNLSDLNSIYGDSMATTYDGTQQELAVFALYIDCSPRVEVG